MIEKREENSSPITAHGIHESFSTISLETVDLYLKQLEAQKLQAQADISDSFRHLTSLLHAREKQLLRQVDAIHDHLILILQSRKTFDPDVTVCCESSKTEFGLQVQAGETMNDNKSSVKATPGIEVSLNSKELEDQILTVGKVEMTGTSFMHLSEDNETFIFPCRVQNYQETSQDHMFLYKPLETADCQETTCANIEDSILVSPDVGLNASMELTISDSVNAKDVSEGVVSVSSHAEENHARNKSGESTNLEDGKEEINNTEDERNPRKLSDERSEDVQHWMREILNETNSEPTSCDPERFDLFTVLKCNLNKENVKHENIYVRAESLCPSKVLAPEVVLEKGEVSCTKVDADHLNQQECPAVSAVLNECDLIE